MPKDVRLNSRHFFIIKIPSKRKLQQIVLNHSSDNDTTLPSDNPLRFRKNHLK